MNDKKPFKLTLFYCENSVDQNQLETYVHEEKDFLLNLISLPCSGKVDIPYLIKALEKNADVILLITCENGSCRFLQGNLRSSNRIAALQALLEETGLSSECIQIMQSNKDYAWKTFNQTINEIKQRFLQVLKPTVEKAHKA